MCQQTRHRVILAGAVETYETHNPAAAACESKQTVPALRRCAVPGMPRGGPSQRCLTRLASTWARYKRAESIPAGTRHVWTLVEWVKVGVLFFGKPQETHSQDAATFEIQTRLFSTSKHPSALVSCPARTKTSGDDFKRVLCRLPCPGDYRQSRGSSPFPLPISPARPPSSQGLDTAALHLCSDASPGRQTP
jgi:hypothetical protein